MDAVPSSPKPIHDEPPPLPATPSQEEFDRMSMEQQMEWAFDHSKAAIARYAGRPELYLAENPAMDFRRFEKK